jgi:hypothetical protein
MSGSSILTTSPKSRYKTTADFAAGAIVLAMLLAFAQVMFATHHPATLAAALLHAPFGIIAP